MVLQVKGCRKVSLAVISGTDQHRLVGSMRPLVPPQRIHFLKLLLAHLACKCGWVFNHVFLKFPPGMFKYLAISMRAAVTCMLLLVSFAGNMGVKCGSASILRTFELDNHFMFLQVHLKQSALFEGQRAVWVFALEVLIFVSMGEAHVSLQFACVKECLCTGHKLAFESLLPGVLKHVAPQVRASGEATTAAGNCALARARPGVHSLMLFEFPLPGESCATLAMRTAEQLQRLTADRFPSSHVIHFFLISESYSNYRTL